MIRRPGLPYALLPYEARASLVFCQGAEGRMRGDLRGPMRALGLVGGLGFVLAATTALGAWLGYYLDGRWGTGPWLTLVGTLVGMGVGFFEVGEVLRRMGEDT